MIVNENTAIDIFKEMCGIPHGSYNIDAISEYLVEFAKSHNLKYRQDEEKNVIIWKAATPGYEDREPIMIQGHMDMVAVKTPECTKDMLKEGLDIVIEDDFMYAKDTSLGGDDGIAVAYALALLESENIAHPALECVFTVNEEVGMEGAFGIDLSDCKAKWMLNIDSEEEGVITVSCAGGVRVKADMPFERTGNNTKYTYEIMLTGLRGGHSGTTIHEGKANADIEMAKAILMLGSVGDIYLCSIDGGEKDNAIPNIAKAVIATNIEPETALDYISQIEKSIKEQYANIENNVSLQISLLTEDENSKYKPMDKDTSDKLLELLAFVPNGVLAMCEGIDLVETSSNLGILRTEENRIHMEYLIRSNINSKKNETRIMLTELLERYNCSIELEGDYPGWDLKPDSTLTKHCVNVYKKLYDKEPVVMGVHAGLECGIILDKRPDMECVSIGPNILNIHSTTEKLDLKSTKRVWEYMLELLK